ncbi:MULTISPECIES: TIGR03085 family metal-binding protein [Micromonospora]|uniref:TIGR03085 family protein n=1 Tax=Micromonospora solifontis TaxID=2487138 RepID=A0ABX9WG54_9ACTN|nr:MULTISPECIES: TIGR03085 family metal-binding protein [Micromonospora]NES12223.1 TIGR03085 family protein [Micromonospora sp. PPF5-17B]NES36975.1 TIGR03085 family protein [Micromonospora solifontis]NES54294.1 TIGR03085 family protein [Micromonospora sp. PPF5-6]RNL98916.1 TIGR03085 family protein [Micromonospora solifontis]
MPRYARSEREALADLLLELGPDAPTVNEGWTTRDLAAHLLVRERRPDAAGGILLPPLRRYAEGVRRRVAAGPYAELVARVRRPPLWSPLSNPLTDELANTVEFFIHHEDVRRARSGWLPRDLPAGLQAVLWKRTALLARLALRRFPAALLVQAPGFGELAVGRGGERLRLVGAPGELTLFLSGRQRVARAQVDGAAAPAERLRTADLGF